MKYIGAALSYRKMSRLIDDLEYLGANVPMVYIGSPQSYEPSPRTMKELNEDKHLFKECIPNGAITVHAPYVINMASDDDYVQANSHYALLHQIRAAHYLGATDLILHPGAAKEQSTEEAIKNIAYILGDSEIQEYLDKYPIDIALETMAGSGTQIGCEIVHFSEIFSYLSKEEEKHIKVCLDSTHLYCAGYNVRDYPTETVNQWIKALGSDKITAIHISDSQNPLSSKKDRHENFPTIEGEHQLGYIGAEPLRLLSNHRELENAKVILETPYPNYDILKQQIEYLK